MSPDPAPLPSVQQLLEDFGVHVAVVAFEDEMIDAASLYESGAAPVVLLNSASRRVKQPLPRRAALAHELCHLLHDGGHRELTMVSRFDEHLDRCEQRANGFAPSFLASKSWASKVRATDPEAIAIELGEKWGLSFEGAVWHAKNLKLIDPEIAEKLKKQKRIIRQEGFEAELPRASFDAKPDAVACGLLSDTAIAAFEAGVISRGRLEEIFAL
jgi:Zn-dependent peptidase ImmA (M78 family)